MKFEPSFEGEDRDSSSEMRKTNYEQNAKRQIQDRELEEEQIKIQSEMIIKPGKKGRETLSLLSVNSTPVSVPDTQV